MKNFWHVSESYDKKHQLLMIGFLLPCLCCFLYEQHKKVDDFILRI